jgi:hypothetical protein
VHTHVTRVANLIDGEMETRIARVLAVSQKLSHETRSVLAETDGTDKTGDGDQPSNLSHVSHRHGLSHETETNPSDTSHTRVHE